MFEYFMKHIAGNKPHGRHKVENRNTRIEGSLADAYAVNMLGLLTSGNQF